MKKWMARHGDLLIAKSDAQRPGRAVRVERAILARGEQTGHAHVVTAITPGTKIEGWMGDDGNQYVLIDGGVAVLDHPEHGRIDLEPGTYRVTRQREWDDATSWRQAQD